VATLTADVTDVQRTFTVTDPGSPRVGAYYAIEDEVIALAGFCGGGYVGADWVVDETCWYVARGIEGTLAVAHLADAEVTEFDVTAGGGGGVSNPLTEDLVIDQFELSNANAFDGVGGYVTVGGPGVVLAGRSGEEGLPGETAVVRGGNGNDGNDPGASITVGGGDGAGNAGAIAMTGLALGFNEDVDELGQLLVTFHVGMVAGGGTTGQQGGDVTIQSGTGDDENDAAASIVLRGGGTGGPGNAGGIEFTNGRLGFYGATAVTKPLVPLTIPTVQDVIDALVTLGLVSQEDD
jgi:hypothetical protein